MLFHCGCRRGVLLDVGGNDDRLHLLKRLHLMVLAPSEELDHRPRVGRARIPVGDRRGKEFDEAPGAASPARAIAADSAATPARERSRRGIGTTSALMGVMYHVASGSRIPPGRTVRQGRSRGQLPFHPQHADPVNGFQKK